MKPFLLLFVMLAMVMQLAAQPSPSVITLRKTATAIPEGIAVDSETGDIYITSIHLRKIYIAKKSGNHRDFIATGFGGFGEGLGIKIDEMRNRIWAVSNKKEGNLFISQVHVFDRTGTVQYVFTHKDTINHLFNDLVLDKSGNAWITATMSGGIFYASASSGELHLAFKDSLLRYPNGIQLHQDKMYIATYGSGPLVFDFTNRKLTPLKGYTNKTFAYNLDGLGLRNNTLYGIYNSDSLNNRNAVIAYKLDATGMNITEERIIQQGHPSFREPTTLAIAGNKLYVLATSNLGAYNANKESVQGIEKKLSPVTVLVYNLE